MVQKTAIQKIKFPLWIFFYAIISAICFYFSCYIRFDGLIPSAYIYQLPIRLLVVVVVQVASLLAFRQFNIVISYFSLVDLRLILFSNIVSSGILFVLSDWFKNQIPRGIMILNFLLFTSGIGVSRIFMRYLSERRRAFAARSAGGSGITRPVAIIGAGDAGARLVRELLARPELRWKPVAFFDDDPLKWGQRLHGVPIIGKPELIRDARWRDRFRKIIVAAPSATSTRLGDIARMAADLGITSDTLPAIDQLVDGAVQISQLRPFRIDDLLRRSPIPLEKSSIQGDIRGNVIAVTGAGGSIGSEICRQILRASPRQLLLIERSEVQLFQVEQELLEIDSRCRVVPLIADITDPERLKEIFQKYRPHAIYHAAAHKHVPLMETQPAEAIRNNSLGTANLVRLAHKFAIAKFVLISTDKAINPTNIMGASKRLAEIYLQAFHGANTSPTRFMAVRFGNVLGSSGSVVPTFQKQIIAGGPVTVTHPDVTRYFMTIPEAVGLVLQAGLLGRGGEIFVLDMGEPVKIVDLAIQMIKLYGYRPEEDIKIKFIGLRSGEKLFEEISHHREHLTKTVHSQILRFISTPLQLSVVEEFFDNIRPHLDTIEPHDLKNKIRSIIPEYKPFFD